MGTKVSIKSQDKTADQPGFTLSWDCILGLAEELDSPIYLEFDGAPFTINVNQHQSSVCIEIPRATAASLGLAHAVDQEVRDVAEAAKERYFNDIDKEMIRNLLNFMDGAASILGSREAALTWICTPDKDRECKRPVDIIYSRLAAVSQLLRLYEKTNESDH